MTLNITSSQIKILNASGAEKFNSSQSLVFRKAYYSGFGLPVGANYPLFVVNNITPLVAGDFPVFYITITAGTGNGAQALLNIKQPASGSVFLHQNIVTSNSTSTVEFEYFSCMVVGSQIRFKSTRINHDGTVEAPNTIATLKYELYVYSVTT